MTGEILDASLLRGERIANLRDLFGLSQEDLKEALGVSQGFLSRVERGDKPLSLALAQGISSQYRVPLTFFSVLPSPYDSGPVTFRRKSRSTVREERRVRELYTEASRLFRHLSVESGYTGSRLPNASEHDGDPELCAMALRRADGLGPDEPVKNLTRLLERQGVGVISGLDPAASSRADHDGVSRPSVSNKRPLVATVGHLPGEVQRLTIGHEVGHLVFDTSLPGQIRSTRSAEEARAFRFAAAVLLPATVATGGVSDSLTLHGYLRIKADYGISVGAIVRRARDLGAISAARYRSLNIQISSQGWRVSEPVPVAAEKPLLLKQALEHVYGRSASIRAAEAVGTVPSFVAWWANPELDDARELAKPNVFDLSDFRERRGRSEVTRPENRR
ncbi:XRE family transcriptional regulator [Pengzhenrongella sp.]|jgi:Zn-dependent peptidase ImmA (M78 family)/transcriptional regulator with XRE-family HTH domain|uniref:helix-turn-helix domain-containing protein n=1 Tax=Pengzhenrongella sp. TaxID=2888820 RepID=UPI002F957D78